MPDIVLPTLFADRFGAEIEGVSPSIRLLPIRGDHPDDPDLSAAEICLQGRMEHDVPFPRLLRKMPAVRWVHSTWAGIDEVFTREEMRPGLIMTSSAGAYAPGITEYVLWGLVELARGMRELHEARLQARWAARDEPFGIELRGKRLGIIGYGAIGRHLATAAKALGLEVWATRRTPMLVTGEPLDRWLPSDALPELLAASHFLVITTSLNPSTRHLIAAPELAAMRPGALLVNVGRGAMVDSDALLEALRSGHLGGALLDVTPEEPLPPESPLWGHPNVVITPHLSGDTLEAERRTVELFVANLRLYLAGRVDKLANLVQPEL